MVGRSAENGHQSSSLNIFWARTFKVPSASARTSSISARAPSASPIVANSWARSSFVVRGLLAALSAVSSAGRSLNWMESRPRSGVAAGAAAESPRSSWLRPKSSGAAGRSASLKSRVLKPKSSAAAAGTAGALVGAGAGASGRAKLLSREKSSVSPLEWRLPVRVLPRRLADPDRGR